LNKFIPSKDCKPTSEILSEFAAVIEPL
jgi:hypothetical protein